MLITSKQLEEEQSKLYPFGFMEELWFKQSVEIMKLDFIIKNGIRKNRLMYRKPPETVHQFVGIAQLFRPKPKRRKKKYKLRKAHDNRRGKKPNHWKKQIGRKLFEHLNG